MGLFVCMGINMKLEKIWNFIKKYWPLFLSVLVVFILGIGYLIYHAYHNYEENKDEAVYEEIRSNVYNYDFAKSLSESSDSISNIDNDEETKDNYYVEEFLNKCGNRSLYNEYLNSVPDFNKLISDNEDVVGYVVIPETPVSYPVLQNPDNEYYLNNSIQKQPNANGAIFIENYNSRYINDPVTIIYGHHLLNKAMFGSLTDYYYDDEYLNNHPYFIIYTPDYTKVYEIVETSKYSTQHLLVDDFAKDSEGNIVFTGIKRNDQVNIYNKIKSYNYKKSYYTDEEITSEDELVVLSTCVDNSTHRYLVVGKCILCK